MKIGICSDLHLNFVSSEYKDAIINVVRPIASGLDLLLIAGDISTSISLNWHLDCITEALGGIPYYFVLGNHDRWGSKYYDSHKLVTRRPEYIHGQRVQLTPDTILVGVNGWFDAMVGDPQRIYDTNDLVYVNDLCEQNGVTIRARIREWAAEEAKVLRKILGDLSCVKRVLVLTHYPPWANANDDPKYYPWSVCVAVGKAITEIALQNQGVQFDVFCGHTHHKWESKVLDNVTISVQIAEYGEPQIGSIIEV
jgi:predicted phosphohydrolase